MSKDPDVLETYLGECIRSRDWDGAASAVSELWASDAATKAREPLARVLGDIERALGVNGAPVDALPEYVQKMSDRGREAVRTLRRVAEAYGADPDEEGGRDDDAKWPVSSELPGLVRNLRRQLRRCARAAVDAGIRMSFDEEPSREDVAYRDYASPDEQAELIVRELQRAVALTQDGSFKAQVYSGLCLAPDASEDDALKRLSEVTRTDNLSAELLPMVGLPAGATALQLRDRVLQLLNFRRRVLDKLGMSPEEEEQAVSALDGRLALLRHLACEAAGKPRGTAMRDLQGIDIGLAASQQRLVRERLSIFRDGVLRALDVDSEEDALRRLRDLGQVRITSDPPPPHPDDLDGSAG